MACSATAWYLPQDVKVTLLCYGSFSAILESDDAMAIWHEGQKMDTA
jgi:hypothetical protein